MNEIFWRLSKMQHCMSSIYELNMAVEANMTHLEVSPALEWPEKWDFLRRHINMNRDQGSTTGKKKKEEERQRWRKHKRDGESTETYIMDGNKSLQSYDFQLPLYVVISQQTDSYRILWPSSWKHLHCYEVYINKTDVYISFLFWWFICLLKDNTFATGFRKAIFTIHMIPCIRLQSGLEILQMTFYFFRITFLTKTTSCDILVPCWWKINLANA